MKILDCIGGTPILELNRVYQKKNHTAVYVKAEYLNPSGSVKDRAARAMVMEGIRSGKLTRGKKILDATSGSTGIAYAMIGAELGYQVVLCMPANVSTERKRMIQAYGGKIIETDPLEGADGAFARARQMQREHPDWYFYPDQYNNDQNWKAHYETTGEEIWKQTGGLVTHFIAGAGTSGTFVGTARKLKEKNRDIRCILVQPDSPFHGLEGFKHMDSTMNPGIFDRKLADGEIQISTEDAYRMVKRLAREEGLLAGISGAANVLAAIRAAETAPEGSVIVTILCDAGHRYLSEPIWEELE